MSQALYRKYRPQTFADVVGQNHIKTTLQSELETQKVAHAYLFSGPRGLGKTTMARLLAKAVNCLKRKDDQSEPCNACDACQEVITSRSLDVIEIDAASHTGVDNVRENIINHSRFTPTSRKYKVFIIDEVHMLSLSAFNALLKTLEEPPSHVIFILATTESHKVPQTIISRCQHFEFRKINRPEIISRLNKIVKAEGKKIDDIILENITYAAGGCLRDAESLLGQILSLDEKEIKAEQAELVIPRSRFDLALELINYLNAKNTAAGLTLINQLVEDGVNLEKFTSDLIEVLRKILLIKISRALSEFSGAMDKETEKNLIKIAEVSDLNYLIKIIEVFIAKRQELKFAEIPQLPLELAVVEITAEKNDEQNNPKPPTPKKEEKIEIKKIEIKEEVVEKPKTKKISRFDLNLEQIKEKWFEVLNNLKNHNQSLASTLKICQPTLISQDGVLEISLQHRFHQERLMEIKNRALLEKTLSEIFGVPLIIKTVLVKELKSDLMPKPKIDEAADGLEDILKTFGGQVVE